MKIQKQKDTGLKKSSPRLQKSGVRFRKAGMRARVAGGAARDAVRDAQDKEEGEEETRGYLSHMERRAWDRLTQRKKRRFLEQGRRTGEKAGNRPGGAGPGRKAGAGNSPAGAPASKGGGAGMPPGWRRAVEAAPQPPGTGGKAVPAGAKKAALAGKAPGAASMPGKAAQAAPGFGAAAAGGAAIGAIAAKRASGKFRQAFQSAQAAKDRAFQEWTDAAAFRMEEAKKADTFGGMAVGMAVSIGMYAAVKVMAALMGVMMTLVGILASVFPAVIVVALVVLVVVVLVPLLAGTVQIRNMAMVDTARQELEVSGENIGGTKYKEWYGLNGNWCAMFVTWCADQCGYIESGVVPRTASVAELHAWYGAKGEYHGKAGYIPKAGDLILFEGPGRSHVGIVESWDAAASVVTTIEGNVEGNRDHTKSRVARYCWPISSPDITGFCAPDYPATVGSLSGGSNAEKAYRAFVDAGYTPEASAAICGNLAGEGGVDASGDLVINSTENGGQGPGIGICQWTSEGRKSGFLAYAQERGEPWPETGLAVQLEYMMKEMSGNIWLWTSIGAEYGEEYHISHAEFKACRDLEFATTAFCANFEICHKANAHLENRIAYAQKVLDNFGSYRGTPGGQEGPPGTETGQE